MTEAEDLELIEAAWHPSNLRTPQLGRRFCQRCQRMKPIGHVPWSAEFMCSKCQMVHTWRVVRRGLPAQFLKQLSEQENTTRKP